MKTLRTVIVLALLVWVSTIAGNAEMQSAGGTLTILDNVHGATGYEFSNRVAVTYFPEEWTGLKNISKLMNLPALKRVGLEELDRSMTSIYELEFFA